MRRFLEDLAIVQNTDRTMRLLRGVGAPAAERITDEPQGLSEGVGRCFFVDSGSSLAASSNTGLEPRLPLATLAQALSAAEANRGDVIYLAAGHAENVAAAYNITKAGVSIVGLGRGNLRPTFTFTATAANFAISAADVYIHNIACSGGIDEVVSLFVISGARCTLDDVGYIENATYNVRQFVLTTAAADDLKIINCNHVHETVSDATSAIWIELIGADRAKILDSSFFITLPNHASSSTIAVTGTAALNIEVGRVYINQRGGTTQDNIMSFVANTTGFVHDVRAFGDVGTLAASMDLASCGVSEVYVATTVLKNGILEPVVA